jgi:hypothetical protein
MEPLKLSLIDFSSESLTSLLETPGDHVWDQEVSTHLSNGG